MLKNIKHSDIEKLEAIIQQRICLEKELNLAQRLFKFLYDLHYESYWIEKNMLSDWRYKTIKQEDVSYEKDKTAQKTYFSFEYNTSFYTASLRIPENQPSPRAFITIMREEKMVFSCIMEKEPPQNIWLMTSLEAFITTDNWFEDLLTTADLFCKEWESLQENKHKEKTPVTDTVDTLKKVRDFEEKQKKFIE